MRRRAASGSSSACRSAGRRRDPRPRSRTTGSGACGSPARSPSGRASRRAPPAAARGARAARDSPSFDSATLGGQQADHRSERQEEEVDPASMATTPTNSVATRNHQPSRVGESRRGPASAPRARGPAPAQRDGDRPPSFLGAVTLGLGSGVPRPERAGAASSTLARRLGPGEAPSAHAILRSAGAGSRSRISASTRSTSCRDRATASTGDAGITRCASTGPPAT